MRKFGLLLAASLIFMSVSAQDDTNYKEFEFTNKVNIKTTPVKDQQRTGTCWSFATTSFIETELLRMGYGEVDLSEMYFARHGYENKAMQYFRYQGNNNFGQGGQAHDVLNVVKQWGFVPENAYMALNYGETIHVHGEMEASLLGVLDAVIKNKNRKVTPVWFDAYKSILDTYLGSEPTNFAVNNKTFASAKDFQNHTKFNTDDYIEITSYNHHPYYSQFVLEIPDNWSHDLYYNLPIEDLIAVMDNAVANGYSVCWDGDVSEKGFSHKNGLMILPASQVEEIADSEKLKWEKLSDEDRAKQMYSFTAPVPEINVTQENRQENFDNYKSTDDHLMHLVGTAKDKNGTKYYLIKNSWNTDSNNMGGYLYMSESYAKMKTVAIMIHKKALPKAIAKKLGIK